MRWQQKARDWVAIVVAVAGVFLASTAIAWQPEADDSSLENDSSAKRDTRPGDWPQFGGTSLRNNSPDGKNIPTDWNVKTRKNISWSSRLGTKTYSTPAVANGKVYVGTNNGAGYIKRFPPDIDLGCLLCFDEQSGEFLWQHSSRKLPTGNPHDYEELGICSTPLIEGDRLWFVSSRGCVICLDTEGFRDEENDGPFQAEEATEEIEADVVWQLDMMKELRVSQHNMCNCSVTSAGDVLLVTTSNGVDRSHERIPAPEAPSFLALDKTTGKLLWTDNSPGANILHGQWSSPAFAVLGGVQQAIFAGGDGWLYSFHPGGDGHGKARLLWRFDCNPKTAIWKTTGRSDRDNLIATPVVHQGRVYVAMGRSPNPGTGPGRLWCINPSRRIDGADVSPELVRDRSGKPVPHSRIQAVDRTVGHHTAKNPNSAAFWCYTSCDTNGNGKIEFEETMHRTISTIAVKNELLIAVDLSGVVHCLNAKTGEPHWTCDLLSSVWGSPLIVEDKVYIGDLSGRVSIFRLSADPKRGMQGSPASRCTPFARIVMHDGIYSTPIVANNVLYVATSSRLFAIQQLPEE
jgi:outer membrane protein assembly factor BamB